MLALLEFLRSVEADYRRTIFNFHISNCPEVGDVYGVLRARILETSRFEEVAPEPLGAALAKVVYCDISTTKHLVNPAAFAPRARAPRRGSALAQFFDVHVGADADSRRTAEIFDQERSSLVSYVKTTAKRCKIDYGEIKRTIHGGRQTYFAGRRSDDYLSTTVRTDPSKPWIKSISKQLRVDILHHSICTRGKSSILQTIEIVLSNRTCVKIFKDSTMHIILSKDEAERGCADLVDKLFGTYATTFRLLAKVAGSACLEEVAAAAERVLALRGADAKLAAVAALEDAYGVRNFKIGMFNLTFAGAIAHTVFPSLIPADSKIKFFKGKKLNIVAVRSTAEGRECVEQARALLTAMRARSEALAAMDVATASVDLLKELLTRD
ncbi:putative intermediate transcription factor VITF-3 [Parapoxvirus red deer/HL953]|uniref:Intermediate transcription factor 3 large subunit n=1 Tax=Parapoxvirus red deer/HL953 TaxID=1579460 RepID=A0A0A7MEU9_9POXV|nr:putative intermediate transcription factor VITF-3 [Parapoxvirus red deer/HL953]AIZ77351.1 putative intermediate transcription factor VITF-3 [Parapoxvirus red deer/HL953]